MEEGGAFLASLREKRPGKSGNDVGRRDTFGEIFCQLPFPAVEA